MATPTLSERNRGRAVLAFSIFLMGLGSINSLLVKPLGEVIAARSWSPAPCVVMRSQLSPFSDGQAHAPSSIYLDYVYRFQGRVYHGDRYDFSAVSVSDDKRPTIARLSRGTMIPCWVDPANPRNSVIKRNAPLNLISGVIPLLMVVLGALATVGYWTGNSRALRPFRGVSFKAIQQPLGALRASNDQRLSKLASAALGSVVLTTVAATMTADAIVAEGPIGLGFIIPAAVVVASIAFAVTTFRRARFLFDPRVQLRLGQPDVAIGDEVLVKWRVAGPLSRLARLNITLEGVEETMVFTSSRGEVTNRNAFATIFVASLTARDIKPTGSEKIAIPADSAPSSVGKAKRVVWRFRLRADMVNGDRTELEFPLIVSAAKTLAETKKSVGV